MSKSNYLVLVVFILLSFASWNVFAGTKEAAVYYEKALTEYNKKNYKSAEIQLKNAIQQDSAYLAAYILLAKTHLVNGNGAGAEKEIKRAMKQGADKQLALPLLADALIIQNKYAEVLERIPALGFNPDFQSTLLLSRGEAHMELRQIDEALKTFEEAQFLQPSSQGPYLGIASVRIAERNYEEAERQISRALDININSAQAWQLKASIKHAENNIEKTFEFYDRSLSNDPFLLSSLLGRASLYYDTQQYDKALVDLDLLTEKYPLEPRVSYLKQSVLRAQGNDKKADEILSNTYAYLEKIPFENIKKHASMLLLAGVVSYEIAQYEKALTYLKEYNTRYPGEHYPQKLLGTVLLTKNAYREAAHLLELVNKRQPGDYQVLTLLGSAYMNMRLYGKANDLLEEAIKLRESASPARMQKAFNELKFGNRDIALEELEKLFELSLDPRSGLMLTTLYMKGDDFVRAEKITQQIVDNDAEHLVARNILGVTQIELGKYDLARKNFKYILSRQGDFFPANMNLVKLDSMTGNIPRAEERLNVLLDKKRNLPTVYLALSKLSQQQNKVEDALRWAEKSYDADDKNISAILHLTRLYLTLGDSVKALRIAESGAIKYSDNVIIKQVHGESLLAAGKIKRAQLEFKDISKLASYDAKLLYKVSRLQFEASDIDGGIWSLKKAVEGDSAYIPARHALIEALISLKKLDSAKEQLSHFKQYDLDPLYLRLQGDWYLASKTYERALESYKRSMQLDPKGDTAAQLFRVYAASGDLTSGIAVLKNWLEKENGDIRAKNLLAEAYMTSGNQKSAVKLFEEVINDNPKHAGALNNLAVIYLEQGMFAQALDYAKKAQAISPSNPAFNDTLGWSLTKSGNPQEGILYLRNANARVTENAEIKYHIAATLAKLGRTEEALSELNSIISKPSQPFPSKEAATKLHRSLAQ